MRVASIFWGESVRNTRRKMPKLRFFFFLDCWAGAFRPEPQAIKVKGGTRFCSNGKLDFVANLVHITCNTYYCISYAYDDESKTRQQPPLIPTVLWADGKMTRDGPLPSSTFPQTQPDTAPVPLRVVCPTLSHNQSVPVHLYSLSLSH